MKKQVLYVSILILPFLGMIMINEFFRANSHEQGFTKYGVNAINSGEGFKHKCSFICHDKTKNYCQVHHVKLAKSYVEKINPIYYGIIDSLYSTDSYRLANLIIFVIILPLIMYVLLVKSISLEFKIRKLKNGKINT
tara:strand:- start:101 stop:511 length:411 start_codon:yes stop_codon:yes gene_type:complete